MAITLREKLDSRQSQMGESPSVTLTYDLDGTADDITAKGVVLSSTPTIYDGLERQSVELAPVCVDSVSNTGLWLVTVKYGAPTSPQPGESSFSFDTSGGTQHITQSIETVGGYANDAMPDFQGAIGVTHDSVEGVDITVPVFSFSVTRCIAAMSPTYINNLYLLTGRTNSVGWTINVDGVQLTFAAGEALFLGASGSKRTTGDWEIAYKFSASPNANNLSIGNINGINKKGWEYLWVRYVDDKDAGAMMMVKKPLAVYVEKVYQAGDFSLLGI